MSAIFKGLAVVGLIVGYALASHLALTLPNGRIIAALLAVGVPALAFIVFCFQYLYRHQRLVSPAPQPGAIWLAVAGLLAVLPTSFFVWAIWPALLANAQNLYFVQHVGTNALLAWVFGRTLVAGTTPLVVSFARIAHPALPPEIESYARKVTLAWTIFFLVTCAVSGILFAAAPIAAWSAFAVLLQWPSVGAFFVGEYLLRKALFRHFDHASLKQGFDAYQQHQVRARPVATTKP
jgi:uncharacterized membrane protein